ncbi:hypothetical protein, conserved [Leishmania tarentolae]|uniref:Uncharacterized protein n=1 Tax=Leishmania tarentolae TaxID=5689 RepID=A0A640KDM2_LEITA|nr:hypothetical protein, conserved [Leishmania tarentolae]
MATVSRHAAATPRAPPAFVVYALHISMLVHLHRHVLRLDFIDTCLLTSWDVCPCRDRLCTPLFSLFLFLTSRRQHIMSQEEAVPRFDFNEGTGVALGTLPCFTSVSTRGAAGKALEAALEPLHRIAYGRAGNNGKRRAALAGFKGFPLPMETEVSEKIAKLTKDRLRAVIKALGINVHISLSHAEVAAGVTKFLMAPRDDDKFKGSRPAQAKPKKASPEKRPASADPVDEPDVKKLRPDLRAPSSVPAAPAASPASATSAGPSDDAVLVQVYRRVLTMTPDDRAVLGVKALRTSLEKHFKLADGGLRHKKGIITTAASECVRALKEAEMRAAAAAVQHLGSACATSPPTGTEETAPPAPSALKVLDNAVPASTAYAAPCDPQKQQEC